MKKNDPPIIDLKWLHHSQPLIDLEALIGEATTKAILFEIEKLTLEEKKRVLAVFELLTLDDLIKGSKGSA